MYVAVCPVWVELLWLRRCGDLRGDTRNSVLAGPLSLRLPLRAREPFHVFDHWDHNRNRSVKQFQHKTNPISRDCTTNAKHVFIARVLDFSIRIFVCLVSVSVTDTTGSFEKLQVATHANQSHHSCFQVQTKYSWSPSGKRERMSPCQASPHVRMARIISHSTWS